MAWLTNYAYRKSHAITGGSGAGTNYQIRVHVHYGAGSDSGEDIYTDSKCKADFGDIRFVDDDGETVLDSWTESSTASDNAVFKVEVADDTSSNQSIYIYYGKADATTISNGDNTFIKFDDFTGANLAKWTNFEENARVTSRLDTANDLLVNRRINTSIVAWHTAGIYTTQMGPGLKIAASINRVNTSGTGNTAYTFGFGDAPTTGENGGSNRVIFNSYLTSGVVVNVLQAYSNVGASSSTLCNTTRTNSVYQTQEIRWAADKTEVLLDGSSLGNTTNNAYIPSGTLYPNLTISAGSNSGASYEYVKWVYIAKYVSSEPSHGAWGTEEEPAQEFLVEVTDSLEVNDATLLVPYKILVVSDSCVVSEAVSVNKLLLITDSAGLSESVLTDRVIILNDLVVVYDGFNVLIGTSAFLRMTGQVGVEQVACLFSASSVGAWLHAPIKETLPTPTETEETTNT